MARVSHPAGTATIPSPYVELDRDAWARLRQNHPLSLSADDVTRLRGLGDRLDLAEVEEVYLPLSRLLNFYVGATAGLHRITTDFLGERPAKTPFIIGVAGSVAVGKSTTAGILQRKGFPESYNRRALLRFVAEVKAGRAEVSAPVYSHLTYDIVRGEREVVRQPDVLIVEGLNVLQAPRVQPDGRVGLAVSDFFDFSVYVDARIEHIRAWYIERFLRLRQTAFADPHSYFHRYAVLSDEEARATAAGIWESINEPNLRENVLPTRGRATLVLGKGEDHSVRRVRLRKL